MATHLARLCGIRVLRRTSAPVGPVHGGHGGGRAPWRAQPCRAGDLVVGHDAAVRFPATARTGFDEAILALPFYEPRHAAPAQRLRTWCEPHDGLCLAADAGNGERTGVDILRGLADEGWLGFLGPDAGPAAVSDGD